MLALIQARSNSKRFKKKVLFNIYETPLIYHVIKKIKRSRHVTKIVVATSKGKSDDILVKYLRSIKISVYRGDLNNVALRLSKASKKYKKLFFIRISGDSPLIDHSVIDEAIKIFKKHKKYKVDLITNVFPRKFPKGQSVEIINNITLKNNIKNMNKNQKEHVTKFFYKHFKQFKIINFKPKNKLSNFKLSIDSKDDLKNILKKYDKKKFENFKL